ncbi:MAG: MlaD family protein [Acidobacteriaceae bacterium]
MPSQQEVKWSQLKVGLIVLVSVTLLCALLILMTSSTGLTLFSHKIHVRAYFANANGLKPGAPVGLEGVTVGEVKSVSLVSDPGHRGTPVEVVMRIDPRFRSGLHRDSRVSLSTVGVLGDTVVDINSRTASGPEVHEGDVLQAVETPSMNDVVRSSQSTVESLDVVLARLNGVVAGLQNGTGTAGRLFTDPEMYEQTTQTLIQLQTLLQTINRGEGSIGKLLHDEELYDHLNDTTNKLDDLVTGLKEGRGTAGKLLTDDSLYNNLNSTMKHANALLAQADAGKGTLGMMMKDPAFARKLNDTVTQMDLVLNNVNAGKGTLGKLATNDEAYRNLNMMLTSSNDLVTAIRMNPKKYLVIRLKIF